MPLATIRPMGESGLYHIHFLDASAGHPDQGLPAQPPHVSGQPVPVPPGGTAGHPLPPTAQPKPV